MQGNIIEVYLVYSQLTRRKKPLDLTVLFAQKRDNIDLGIDHRLIFTEESKALHYARFLHESDALLKAYLPETAIEGGYEQLLVKKGVIKKQHIHGGYPGIHKGIHYTYNLDFDQSLLQHLQAKKTFSEEAR